MFSINNWNVVKVTCHPYRTARAMYSVMELDRESADGKALERELAEMAGVTLDNHVVYTVTPRNGAEMHFWCTDSKIVVGTYLEKGTW